MKSKGDYFYVMCDDLQNSLKFYNLALQLVTKGNTVLRREIGELIPICLARLGRFDEAFQLFQGNIFIFFKLEN